MHILIDDNVPIACLAQARYQNFCNCTKNLINIGFVQFDLFLPLNELNNISFLFNDYLQLDELNSSHSLFGTRQASKFL